MLSVALCSRPRGTWGAAASTRYPSTAHYQARLSESAFFPLPSTTRWADSHRLASSCSIAAIGHLAMFCARCLRSSVRRPTTALLATRAYVVASPSPEKPLQPSTPVGEAQSFSSPLTPSPKTTRKPNAVVSGTLVGTPLRHINYLKAKTDPIALEDWEYPDWLWTLLGPSKTAATAEGEAVGDLYCESLGLPIAPLPQGLT